MKEIELMETDKYLEMCLKVDQIFFYSKAYNSINISIDPVHWGDVFHNKEKVNSLF